MSIADIETHLQKPVDRSELAKLRHAALQEPLYLRRRAQSVSVAEAVTAIDRYFAERNQEFREHPKRAGGKIWGNENVAPKFSEANNCKNQRYMNAR